MFGLMVPVVIWAVYTLNSRLNDSRDESSSLNLKTGNGKQTMSTQRPCLPPRILPLGRRRSAAHPVVAHASTTGRAFHRAAPPAADVSEFRVGDKASIPSKADIEAAMGVGKSTDERSRLLNCAPPCAPKQQ